MKDTNTRTRKTGAQSSAAGAVTVLLVWALDLPVEVAIALTVILTPVFTWLHNYALWRGWLPEM